MFDLMKGNKILKQNNMDEYRFIGYLGGEKYYQCFSRSGAKIGDAISEKTLENLIEDVRWEKGIFVTVDELMSKNI
jgi:predicted peroxiredoxin